MTHLRALLRSLVLGLAACSPTPQPAGIRASDESDRYLGAGNRCLELADYSCAIASYAEAVRLNPRSGHALTNLAWVLATCPRPEYRDGPRATMLADSAVQIATQDGTLPDNLGYPVALAAAYAESGNYSAAVATMRRVLAIARQEGHDQQYVPTYERYLASYLAEQPWRYSPP